MKKLSLLFLVLLAMSASAQNKQIKKVPVDSLAKVKKIIISENLPKHEQELQALFNRLLKEDTNDSMRIAINEEIRTKLHASLRERGSFLYGFDSLSSLGKIYSNDYNLRIYTWACELEDLSYRFYGFIQDFDDEKIYPLMQNSAVYLPAPDRPIAFNRWYGALYYNAIKVQSGDFPVYILLGWSQPNPNTKMKVMDVLDFGNERLVLGSPIFKGIAKKGKDYRLLFTYCSELNMSLNYEEKQKRFVFDHLTPMTTDRGTNPATGETITENRGCNGPDMSYDALQQKRKNWFSKKFIWVLKRDVNVTNDFD
ncbi:MAG: hypothetical protein LBR81_04360 [Prevotellaceae bacterium]|jgi:hypothetical protein|nr:hypothetical protein [Prevotellaceae bacterium]